MDYFLNKMAKIEDIIIWILIFAIIGIALWMLHGSPSDAGAIIGIAGFISASEILIWKKFFCVERDTKIGFAKVKHDLNLMENKINNKLDVMHIGVNNKLDNLDTKLGKTYKK